MRIGFVAGSLNSSGSRILIARPDGSRPFPGPWTTAAVIRISERTSSKKTAQTSGASAFDASRRRSRAR
jgi:hypothetical protein